VLRDRRIKLRELVKTDALSLLSMLSTEEVAKFISPPPTTPQGFEKFISWAHRERQAGNQFTFGMVPEGCDHAIGLVQVRAIAPRFSVAEWGFAVGSPFWGTGIFLASARMTLDFAFQHTAVNRLEARAVVQNGRGQRRAAQAWRRAGGCAARIAAEGRQAPRSDHVVDHFAGLVPGQSLVDPGPAVGRSRNG
jgi:RimJ/RimL family protein N-acetyltransferase